MSHDKNCILLAQLRELSSQCLHSLVNIISLFLLTHPVHEGCAEGSLLEVISKTSENLQLIGIFHARNNIQRGHSYAGIAFLFQLFQSFLWSRISNALICLDTVNNNVRGKSSNHLYARMSCLNLLNSSFNGSLTSLLEGSAEAHNKNGVLVLCISHSRILISHYTNLRRVKESRSSGLYLRA